jgi:hypothetical protein
MPPLLALSTAILIFSVHLPVLAWALRAAPENLDELLGLNAVLLLHASAAEVTVNRVRFFGFAHWQNDTEHMYGSQSAEARDFQGTRDVCVGLQEVGKVTKKVTKPC